MDATRLEPAMTRLEVLRIRPLSCGGLSDLGNHIMNPLSFFMRLPDPSRDPKTLLICGSRTPAGIMFSYWYFQYTDKALCV